MKSLKLLKNPEIFQGEKIVNTNKSYFEGWYFKNTNDDGSISFIPGINIEKDEKKAFIQVITDNSSYFVNYNIEEFMFNHDPFSITIGNNVFSKEGVKIDIVDEKQNIKICGNLKYSNIKNIYTNTLNPNIMGPFSYIPFMECNHAILSMKHDINGSLKINDKQMNFDNSIRIYRKRLGMFISKIIHLVSR